MAERVLVVDGDDTLWETEVLYDDARQAARRIVESAGVDGDQWERLERRVDVERASQFGFSPERFAGSCVLAYESIALMPDVAVSEAVRAAADRAISTKAETYPDTRAALDAARAWASWLVLLTKGDRGLQHRRIAESGLTPYFDQIVIANSKSPTMFRSIATMTGAAVCWSIGNSLGSDIRPAVAAGFNAVWVDRHVWEFEASDPQTDSPVATADSLSDAVSIMLDTDEEVRGS